jgi:hypothetical protein
LLIQMLIIGYCFGIRSERRLCEEVHLNLVYRWFCRLGLDGEVPDRSIFSKNRHGRFRESDLLRRLFEAVLQRCIDEGFVGGKGFAVDANLIQADASDRTRVEGAAGLPPDAAGRAVEEYLAVLDDAAFGAASEVTPKFIAPADPATRWTRSGPMQTDDRGGLQDQPALGACGRGVGSCRSPGCRYSPRRHGWLASTRAGVGIRAQRSGARQGRQDRRWQLFAELSRHDRLTQLASDRRALPKPSRYPAGLSCAPMPAAWCRT